MLHGFERSLGGNAADVVEEIVQVVIVRVWQQALEKKSPRAFFITCLQNEARSELRRLRVRRGKPSRTQPDDVGSPQADQADMDAPQDPGDEQNPDPEYERGRVVEEEAPRREAPSAGSSDQEDSREGEDAPRRSAMGEQPQDDSLLRPESRLLAQEEIAIVRALLHELSERDQAIIRDVFDEANRDAVARIYGTTRANVDQIVSRFRKRAAQAAGRS